MDILFLQAKNHSSKTLLFVGGSGEDRNTYKNSLAVLQESFPEWNMCAFSYMNNDESAESLVQTVVDLRVVMTYLSEEKKQASIFLWTTSMGAYPTCRMLGSNEFSGVIERVMFCDPADYPQKNFEAKTWSGCEEYDPKSPVASDWLRKMNSKTKVTVVHFLLKNYGPDGYIEKKYVSRGKHNEDGFTRLSTDMVKAFWDKLPERNRGRYFEERHIPHAILRDGNIKENQERLLELIVKWMG